MPKGGHAHSGPPPVEGSRTSDRRGHSLRALPREGYKGEVPELTELLEDATLRHERIWADLWRSPQACAWSQEPWCWQTVADLVMWIVRSHAEGAAASTAANVRQLRDDCGLTAAGMARNGWKIAEPPTASDAPTASNVTDIKSRLTGGA